MEVGEQQEDAAGAGVESVEQKQEEATAMERGEEQGAEAMGGVEAGEQQEGVPVEALVEREDAVMESLPVEVDTDKLRSEREKAPDNAEERLVNEVAGGLGFPGEKAVRVSDGDESREVGLDGAGERNGTGRQVQADGEVGEQAQEDVETEGDAAMPVNDAETEVEMVDAAAAIDDGEGEAEEGRSAEEKPAGTKLFTRIVLLSTSQSAKRIFIF